MTDRSTFPLRNRIAVAFDFDETLIPQDSFDAILARFAIDKEEFDRQKMQPLLDNDWEKYLARAYCLTKISQQRPPEERITREKLAEVGQNLKPIEGVPEMFDRLRDCTARIDPELEIEFYLITGGFVELARNNPIATNFKQMWGCEFSYNAAGEIDFIKQQMTHVEKTRYLFNISQGIDRPKDKDLIYNYRDFSVEELHVPLDQTIYVGDGTSDVPCFAIMNQYNGFALGIYKPHHRPEEWEHHAQITRNQKVANLVPAEAGQNSELMRSLRLCIESIGKKIALRKLSIGE